MIGLLPTSKLVSIVALFVELLLVFLDLMQCGIKCANSSYRNKELD